ncbi:MAG: hypothetical protein K0Q87_4633 [Neobacillus sp.]|jgi:hypothetical protein|nr:hypothetical protein [Neobacillus sp.]MDF2858782.1 hypothetical protein [Neobacillus sp.]
MMTERKILTHRSIEYVEQRKEQFNKLKKMDLRKNKLKEKLLQSCKKEG